MAVVSVFVLTGQSRADIFDGAIHYTKYTGGQNVWRVDYSYDNISHVLTLSNNTPLASVNGADGIIFAPNGNLLIGGQGSGLLHERAPDGSFVRNVFPGTTESYHLTLSPDRSTVYTSPFNGPLDVVPLVNGGLSGNGTAHAVTGNDRGVTQVVFDGQGRSYYATGNPNGFGNFGRIDLNTYQTTRLLTGQTSIHGTVFDPFTGLITFFGAGAVGTYDPVTGAFLQRTGVNADFDQGAVDGLGHAFIAGNNQITFIDYSATGDITSPLNVVQIRGGFNGIDDVAPLVGPGSRVFATALPAPPSVALLLVGGAALLGRRWRRGQRAA